MKDGQVLTNLLHRVNPCLCDQGCRYSGLTRTQGKLTHWTGKLLSFQHNLNHLLRQTITEIGKQMLFYRSLHLSTESLLPQEL